MKKEKNCTTPKSITLIRVDVEIHLNQAAVELRAAWLLCKRNGMEATAKELHEGNMGQFDD